MHGIPCFFRRACFLFLLCLHPGTLAAGCTILRDSADKTITIADGSSNLVLHLNLDGRCLIDQVIVRGHEVVAPQTGVCTGLLISNTWFTSRAGIRSPRWSIAENTVTVSNITYGCADLQVRETWKFTLLSDQIVWQITRDYLSGGVLHGTLFPGWNFQDISTWTGALLGHGGVAWCQLFNSPNASYGVHNGKATFWNKDLNVCLRIVPESPDQKIAMRFTRHPNGVFSINYSASESERVPKHGLSRFLHNRQDVWQPFAVKPGRHSVTLTLSAPDYNTAYDCGTFRSLNGNAIREISHTIARIGAIDELIMGSNGYYSDVAVLHEPWLAQLGLAIDDPDYTRAFADTLDFQRQHAIGPDGRVKSRWCGNSGDAMPGTYDRFGFYECQWGWLMDSQTSWVINVADQFDFSGDRSWLRRQKAACEKVLEYLLHRDTDGNGLVKMMTDSESEAKGSDWIDVVWAAYENALVNAQAYWALQRWADCEELLSGNARAGRYRKAAAKLKTRYNLATTDGGFWDARNQDYVYWRDKDGSVHGTNLVVPVNFSAIGYGLCDEPARRAAILNRIESLMRQEGLFFWPLCFFSYAKSEGHPQVNWPFPSYENGDIFLAWGELGTRAYAAHDPALALKYVKNVLAQYGKDGLAFQRYLRRTQTGTGNDILANNCSIVVGLYRNIYGIQPKYNRLFLEPHLVPELSGTRLKYSLRGKLYNIDLNVNDYTIAVDRFTVRSSQPFAVNAETNSLQYFAGHSSNASLTVIPSTPSPMELTIRTWPQQAVQSRAWTETGQQSGVTIRHQISGLTPNKSYELLCEDLPIKYPQTDVTGCLTFDYAIPAATPQNFEIRPR